MKQMTLEHVERYRRYLVIEERSRATIEKYVRDVTKFYNFLPEGKPLDKEWVVRYKNDLISIYKPSSINSMLVALNVFFVFLKLPELKVRLLKVQRKNFCSKEIELSKEEYCRLVETARRCYDEKWDLIIETICSTGIRVGELRYITVEAVAKGKAEVNCKGKLRLIMIPAKLQRKLQQYSRSQLIGSGCVFVTRNGNPVNRSNIWKKMKHLCDKAMVPEEKVYPHNLRHLFARTYYGMEGDIVHLADMLGHSNIETTRIYTMTSSGEQAKLLENMELVL